MKIKGKEIITSFVIGATIMTGSGYINYTLGRIIGERNMEPTLIHKIEKAYPHELQDLVVKTKDGREFVFLDTLTENTYKRYEDVLKEEIISPEERIGTMRYIESMKSQNN